MICRISLGLLAALSVSAALSSQAGTRGGIYDFNGFFAERHPFDAGPFPGPASGLPAPLPAGYGAPAYVPPVQVAPPPPTLRYTPPPRMPAASVAQIRPAAAPPPRDDGWFAGWFDGIYVSIGGGLDFPEDQEETVGGTDVDIDVDSGFVADLAVGTNVGENIRAELAFAYRSADLDEATTGGNRAEADGDVTNIAVMLNGYYDVPFEWFVRPYVGAGIGVAFADVDEVTVGGVTTSGDDSTEFAFQGIVGLAYPVWDGLTLTVDYRYFGTTDDDIGSNTVQAGLRYRL